MKQLTIEEIINSERVLNELGIWQKEVIARVMQNYAEQEKKNEAIALMGWFFNNGSNYFIKKYGIWEIANPYDEITGGVTPEQLYKLFKQQK